MRRPPVLTWMLLALLFVPVAAAWCLVWLWWKATAERGDLPPGGEPRLPLVGAEEREPSWLAPDPLLRQ